MSFVILDLEWNTTFCKELNKYVNEIVEFGAVKLDSKLRVTETFSTLVRPTVAKSIHPQVKKLVNISFDELKESPCDFPEILDKFAEFLGDSTLITWSNTDLHTLSDNCSLHSLDENLPFMKTFCDLQKYCEYSLGVSSKNRMLGLSACAQVLGFVEGENQSHRALDDTMLSLKCLKALYNKRHFEEFIEVCDEEFFKKLRFKSKFITNANNPNIDREQLNFDCPECEVRCIRKSKWSKQNNSMLAFFVCPECKQSYKGRVQAKLKYEGVSITKRLMVNNSQNNKD